MISTKTLNSASCEVFVPLKDLTLLITMAFFYHLRFRLKSVLKVLKNYIKVKFVFPTFENENVEKFCIQVLFNFFVFQSKSGTKKNIGRRRLK